jgi:uncharacterized membrane protein YheB (UPF0754 family)
LRRSIEELTNAVDRVKTNLTQGLTLAVETASTALGKHLKETFASELSEAIKEQITIPFHADVERLKRAISESSVSITAGVRELKEGTREFKQEYSNLARASVKLGDDVTDAGNVLNSLTHKFEAIVVRADLVAQKLKESEGELALAIERSQNNHNGHNVDQMKVELLQKVVEDSRRDRQLLATMIERFAGRDFPNQKRPTS